MELGYLMNNPEDFHKGLYQNVSNKQYGEMYCSEFSLLSSLRGEFKHDDFIKSHYKESYRLAIDRLVKDGIDSYHRFLKEERIGSLLSEEEILFITSNAEQLSSQNPTDEVIGPPDNQSSSGTYWPTHSDVETPNLDLGWPDFLHEQSPTNINMFYHPPRLNKPTIKEVIRKSIQDARQVIAIVMDKFTDVDIFKEIMDASVRGVPVYLLLSDCHFKGFLKMVENEDVKIQHLRNMRVRTVKGQDYLCRSGAKFHGGMEQKFILIDCHTTIYGSYSFTWSFEKIHLSNVQVITGRLVNSYDEEFRTLYARSIVPAELESPMEGSQINTIHEQQILPQNHSAPKIGWKNQLGHSFDVASWRTYGNKSSIRCFEDRQFEENGKFLMSPMKVQQQGLESLDEINLRKRHSYAWERQDECIPRNTTHRGSNWNICRDAGISPNNYPMDNYLPVPPMRRGQNMRQSYNGIDKKVLSMQQNMPLDNSSKSFMRTWRIESYLKNPDAPSADTFDCVDQFETMNKASFMQGQMRNSIAVRYPIPNQLEPSRLMVTSNTSLHYTSKQRDPALGAENRINSNEFGLKQKGSQFLDNFDNTEGNNSGKNSFHSLSRAIRNQILTNPDKPEAGWHKRHSVADPRSSMENTNETSAFLYERLVRTDTNRSTAKMSVQNGGYKANMNEDQRSLSHYDVKNIAHKKGPNTSVWHNLPSRTVSAAALHLNNKELVKKSSSINTQHTSKNSSPTMQSLLNIPESKDNFIKTMDTPSLSSGESNETITGDNDSISTISVGKQCQTPTSSVRSLSESYLNSSKQGIKTEEHQDQSLNPHAKITTQKKRSILGRNLSRVSIEKKNPVLIGSRRAQPHEKTKSLSRADAAVGNSQGNHENKLEKFIHRVGSLLNKNK